MSHIPAAYCKLAAYRRQKTAWQQLVERRSNCFGLRVTRFGLDEAKGRGKTATGQVSELAAGIRGKAPESNNTG